MEGFEIFIVAAVIIVLVIIYCVARYFYDKRHQEPKNITYSKRLKYISACEQKYYKIILQILKDTPYVVFPQVPLSQIVNKLGRYEHRGELNRVIDFGIFSDTYEPLLCIEINDSTHDRSDRIERDVQVKGILCLADIPLLTFWPKNGINAAGIEEGIKSYIDL